ncbi:alpha/beta-hydrolase [Mycena filopes]|nr:alpha/beta-hydrolase [Mycena filopes]
MSSSSFPALAPGIESRTLTINDLEMHILEATPEHTNSADNSKPPLIILLHGFPELAYSWRKVIRPLADAGYHVVAPDQRGYGRTVAHGASLPFKYSDDLTPFRVTNFVNDIVTLVHTLGYSSAAVVGHDFGSHIAAWCALIRPDMFPSVVMMASPFTGPPAPQLPNTPAAGVDWSKVAAGLAALDPPRKHYMLYYSTPEANADMTAPPNGLHAFLRAFYHAKSADGAHDTPHPLSLSEMGTLPHYYVMGLHETMPAAVHSADEPSASAWLTDAELGVYVAEYARTGFQGGLSAGCRTTTSGGSAAADRALFAGKRITVPAMYLAGTQDWGTYQFPGAADAMRRRACTRMDDEDFVLIDGAGHWVQQEQGAAVVKELLRFFKKCESAK